MSSQAQAITFAAVTLPVGLYFALSEASTRQATWGKRRLRLQVVGPGGRRLGMGRSLARTALKFVPWELAHGAVWGFSLASDAAAPGGDYAVAARRTGLSALPPARIGVGALDLFLDEDRAYAARLTSAGVATELNEVPGAPHGFDALAPGVPLARAFTASQAAFLQVHVGAGRGFGWPR